MKVLVKGRTASRVYIRILGFMLFAYGFPRVRKIDYVAFPLRFLSAFVILLNEEDLEANNNNKKPTKQNKNFIIPLRDFLVMHS